MRVPTDIGSQNAALASRLNALNGREFDRAYIRSQVTAHVRMLQLLQNEVSSGRDPRMKAYARRTIPIIRMHLAMARRAERALMGRMDHDMHMHMHGM